MTHSQVKVTPVTTDSISLNQQEGQAEEPLVRREFPSVSSLRHQPSSIIGLQRQLSFITESICQPTLPVQQYFKSPEEVPLPDRSEDHRFLEKQDYEPSPLRYEDTRQPALELPRTSVAGPRLGSNATGSEGSLPAIFEGTTYYGGQPTPELALAPVGRPAEVVSPPPPEPEVKAEETTQEVAALDIDAIARDVYSIIKWWFGEETEWA